MTTHGSKFLSILALAIGLTVLPSCSFLNQAKPVVAEVTNDVAEASAILNALKAAEDAFVAQHPLPADVQAQIDSKFKAASELLAAAAQAVRGASAITDQDVVSAYRAFATAWDDLMSCLHDAGVLKAGGTQRVPRIVTIARQ